MTLHVLKLAAAGDEQPNPDAAVITFDMFYARYPRKVARKVALASWVKIDPAEHPKIMAALERHRKSEDWRKQHGMFIPYPATWLNQERWTDSDEIDVDMTMGECNWNCNGTREPGKPKCSRQGTGEKSGVVYCKTHIVMVN